MYLTPKSCTAIPKGNYKQLDKGDHGLCPEKELRIRPSWNAAKISAGEVRARMDKQMPEEKKIKRSRFVIYNDRALADQQVLDIHHAYWL